MRVYWWRSRRWRRETPSWSGVLWWACMSVQITNICAYCLWPWLASLATLRHVGLYFWFCGWRHACYNSSNVTSDAGLADAETDSPGSSPDRMQSLLFMIALFHSSLHKKRCIFKRVCDNTPNVRSHSKRLNDTRKSSQTRCEVVCVWQRRR